MRAQQDKIEATLIVIGMILFISYQVMYNHTYKLEKYEEYPNLLPLSGNLNCKFKDWNCTFFSQRCETYAICMDKNNQMIDKVLVKNKYYEIDEKKNVKVVEYISIH